MFMHIFCQRMFMHTNFVFPGQTYSFLPAPVTGAGDGPFSSSSYGWWLDCVTVGQNSNFELSPRQRLVSAIRRWSFINWCIYTHTHTHTHTHTRTHTHTHKHKHTTYTLHSNIFAWMDTRSHTLSKLEHAKSTMVFLSMPASRAELQSWTWTRHIQEVQLKVCVYECCVASWLRIVGSIKL